MKPDIIVLQKWLNKVNGIRRDRLILYPIPNGRDVQNVRIAFDNCLKSIHYAGSCQRVGRCMRLLIIDHGIWVGGIVLGSTFANIDVRDSALGLKRYLIGYQARNLRSPWARENTDYWGRLQKIVNHARTFIFPKFQGKGLGIRSHRILLTQGIRHWEFHYRDKIAAFDTLCDAKDSHLFLNNGWIHVGQTAGFESDPKRELVPILDENIIVKNNVALRKGKRTWEVWIRIIDKSAFNRKSSVGCKRRGNPNTFIRRSKDIAVLSGHTARRVPSPDSYLRNKRRYFLGRQEPA